MDRPVTSLLPLLTIRLGSLAIVLSLVLIQTALAQTTQNDPAAGLVPFSTHLGSAYDSVDPASSNVMVTIPIMSKSGKVPFAYKLVGNSHAYIKTISFTVNGVVMTSHLWSLNGGTYGQVFAADLGAYLGNTTFAPGTGVTKCGTSDGYYSGLYVVDSTGASHFLPTTMEVDTAGCIATPVIGVTTDGSAYTVTITSGNPLTYSLSDRSGFVLNTGTGIASDPDGVSLSASGSGNGSTYVATYTDTLQTTALTATGSPTTSYAYTNSNGVPVTVGYTAYYQKTAFGCASVVDYSGTTTTNFPTSVGMPDGEVYTISYETTPGYASGSGYITGRIAGLTLGSGGSISYTYTGGSNNGVNCTSQVVPTLTRKVNDGNGNVSTWKYVNNNTTLASKCAPGTGTCNYSVVVNDPALNQTIFNFAGDYQTQVSSYQGGCPTTTTGCSGGGTLLKTVTTCYNANFSNCAAPTNVPVTAISQTDVYTSFNGGASNLVESKFDTYGNTTDVRRYDFIFSGAVSPAGKSPLADTLTYYGQSWNGSSACNPYSGFYIYNTPCYSVTNNSAGSPVAQTQITYTSTGHPATTKKWNGSTWLTSSATYNGKGTVATSTDSNGALYTYAYNGTDGCSNSVLPTSVTVTGTGLPSAGLITSTQWNCSGAVATQTSDPNGQPTGYTYNDPLWRTTSMTDPLLNSTNYSYPSPTTFDTQMSFPSQSNKAYTTDGLGRLIESQTRTAPGATTFDNTILYGYSWNTTGAISTQTLPGGSGVTTTQYDAIGRPLSTTDAGGGTISYTYVKNDVLQSVGPSPVFQKQLEYDGLGRLTRVCEITAVSGSGACGESNPATGFLTIYTYDALSNLLTVAQNAQPGAIGSTQTRTYTYDGLSRLTYESNPEWGPGTASYTYDVACGTFLASAGDLTTSVDNAGNTSCYGYDALHRVTDVMVYEAGACYPPVKRFRYDNTTNAILPLPTGYSASYTGGRMVEAWTGDCVWPTPSNGYDSATDEWFAYSKRGEMSDLWESTAHIAGYYHGTATYAANGALASVGGVPGYTAVTYGVDTEGRLSTAAQGTTDLVASIVYTSGSQLKTISFGNGDQDGYLYDANTGRMANYTFTVNGATDSGALTWNSNWTLAKLVITDGINSGGSQTCTYGGYDSFDRLGSVTCGSAWAQAFSYDPFGNITKSGSSAWAPGYNEATNRASSPITYDNNGNMTNDTLRTYAYYVDNKLGSINSTTCNIFGSTDGTCILYDAFGREVERGVNGAYNEVMYTPVGKTAIMNGETTTVSAYFPLPGGATYYQSGSTGANGYFWHKDWLGSVRLSSSVQNRTAYFDRAFAPFGESYSNIANAAGLNFTGDTQDSFAGLLYDTQGRELHPGQGRWLSPDPAGLSAVDPTAPQSWNRYAYVLNNPLSYVDLTGLDCAYLNDWGDDVESVDQSSNEGECGSNGGYWVDGGLTDYQINSEQGQVTLWGTNTGVDQYGNQSYTFAQYQDTTLNVGFYLNSSLNPFGHVAIGIGNQIPMGLDPASFPSFFGKAALRGALGLFNSTAAAFNAAATTSVPGAVNPQTSDGLVKPTVVPIPVTGMQANMIENAIVESGINPPNYTIYGTNGCDCGVWAQQIMGTAGIYSGPPAAIPQDLMLQLLSIY